jgi:opacity protein-like surface antigen
MRIILSVVLVVCISFLAKAQKFNAGFVCGLAATQVDGDGNGGYNKAGPIAGIWVGHRLTSVLYARMELRYIQKGSYAKNNEEGGGGSFYRMRLNYFEIPLILGYRLHNGINPIIGLSGGYLAKAREMSQFGNFPAEDIQKFNKFEFAGLIGLEYNKSEHWAFCGLFSYSIFPIRPHKGNVTYRWDRGQYNRVLELVARYKIQ